MRISIFLQANKHDGNGFAVAVREQAVALSKLPDVKIQFVSTEKIDHTNEQMFDNEVVYKRNDKDASNAANLNYFSISNFREVMKFNPDVLHFHEPSPFQLPYALWAKFTKRKVVFTAHQHCHYQFVLTRFDKVTFSAKFAARFTEWAVGAYMKAATVVVAQTKLNRKFFIQNYDLAPEKVVVIANGIKIEEFQKYSAKGDLNTKCVNLISIGNFEQRKRNLFLVQAIQHLPAEYRLDIFGKEVQTDYYNKICAYIEQHGLQDRVMIHKPINHKEVPETLAKHDIFLFASTIESCPLVLYEAKAACLAIVAVRPKFGYGDVAIDNENGVLLPAETNPAGLAVAIKKLVEDRVAYKKYSQTNFSTRHEDTWDMCALRLEKVYNFVLANRAKDYAPKAKLA